MTLPLLHQSNFFKRRAVGRMGVSEGAEGAGGAAVSWPRRSADWSPELEEAGPGPARRRRRAAAAAAAVRAGAPTEGDV